MTIPELLQVQERVQELEAPGSPGSSGDIMIFNADEVTLIRAAKCRFVELISAAKMTRLPAGVPLKPNGWTDPTVGPRIPDPTEARETALRARTLITPYPEGQTQLVRKACPI